MKKLPELSRFELQCLRKLWNRKEASVREIHDDLVDASSYSTVRKIIERLEQKGAIERIRLENKAWIYRSTVPATAMLRKEIRRFLEVAFDGGTSQLMSHLAAMDEISLADLREIEKQLGDNTSLEQDND